MRTSNTSKSYTRVRIMTVLRDRPGQAKAVSLSLKSPVFLEKVC